MSKPLIERVLEDIKKSGYIFELEISEILEGANWIISPNESIVDSVTGKEFELDIKSIKTTIKDFHGHSLILFFFLLIECKKSSDKPWVFFVRNNKTYFRHFHILNSINNFINSENIKCHINNTDVTEILLDEMFKREKLFISPLKNRAANYCVALTNPNQTNQIYKAIQQVMFQFNNRIISTKSKYGSEDELSWIPVINIMLPVIAYKGEMFEGTLKKGDINLKETKYVQLEKIIDDGSNRTIIHVVHKDFFKEFLSNLGEDIEKIINIFSNFEYEFKKK